MCNSPKDRFRIAGLKRCSKFNGRLCEIVKYLGKDKFQVMLLDDRKMIRISYTNLSAIEGQLDKVVAGVVAALSSEDLQSTLVVPAVRGGGGDAAAASTVAGLLNTKVAHS